MRSTLFIVAGALAAWTTPAAAADIVGLWATPTKQGRVEIRRCGAELCGRLVDSDDLQSDPAARDLKNRNPSLRGRPLQGLALMTGFRGGPLRWSGGKVYNPEDGGTYAGTVEMVGNDKLRLRGCIVSKICKTQVWTRVR